MSEEEKANYELLFNGYNERVKQIQKLEKELEQEKEKSNTILQEYKKMLDLEVEYLEEIDRLQKDNKELKELHSKICEEFLKYNWENSNNKEISNQVKCLYNSIYGEDLLKEN